MDSTIAVYRPMPKQFIIAREGFPFIGIALIAAFVMWLLALPVCTLLMLGLAGFVAFFFRNPERVTPNGNAIVVAPADGRVISVEKNVAAPVTGKSSTRVSIFMSVLNVHINRFPVAARVVKSRYWPGKFFVASLDKASEHNERNALVLLDQQGREFVLVQIAGLIARRIVCYLKEGDALDCGERFGLIRFGSRLDIYLPPEAKIEVSKGMCTRAGETVVGRFV